MTYNEKENVCWYGWDDMHSRDFWLFKLRRG